MAENKKIKILIIDDDNFLLDMYSLKFSEKGFEVVPVSTSEAALSKLRDGLVPDIILLDVVMPKIDGFKLLQMMSEEKLAENAVKVVLSNLGQSSDIENAKVLGASGYIVKASSTPTEVCGKVTEIFSASKNSPK
ncbi:MAG: response regulator [Candidatus Paceibacterota bacterium]|jgi:CheY-like chemotaxis protein